MFASLLSRSALVLVGRLCGSAAALVGVGLLTEALPLDELGRYGFTVSLAVVLAVVARGGQQPLLVRELAASATRGAVATAMVWRSAGIVAVVALIVGGIWWLATPGIPTAWGIAILVTLGGLSVLEGTLCGLGWVVAAPLPQQFVRPVAFLILVGIATLGPLDAAKALSMYWGALALAAGIGIGVLWLAWPSRGSTPPPPPPIHGWLKASATLTVMGGLGILSNRMDILFVRALQDEAATGIYFNAMNFAILPGFALAAVNGVVMPRFSALWTRGDGAALQRLASQAVAFAGMLALPAALGAMGLYVAGQSLGWTLEAGETVLLALLIGQVFNAACGSVGGLLLMCGHEGLVASTYGLSLGLNAILTLILVPRLGPVGAAIGTSVALAAWNVVLVLQSRRILGIDPSLGGWIRPWRPTPRGSAPP